MRTVCCALAMHTIISLDCAMISENGLYSVCRAARVLLLCAVIAFHDIRGRFAVGCSTMFLAPRFSAGMTRPLGRHDCYFGLSSQSAAVA
jgi:hypothetical protein